MKKVITMLVMVLVVICFALAQTSGTQATQAQKPKNMVFKGTVDSVTLADPVKGTKSEIVVISETNKNEKMTFLVKATTTISDADGKSITLDKIQKGNKCTVTYSTTPEKVNEAISIQLLK